MNSGCILIIVAFALTAVAGWISNVVQVVSALTEPITGLFILKCVGILLAPLGSVLGVIGWFM